MSAKKNATLLFCALATYRLNNIFSIKKAYIISIPNGKSFIIIKI